MATQRPQQSSIAAIIIAASAAAGGVAVSYLLPGAVLVWAGLLVAALVEPPAIVTGPKINGRPTPLDDREKSHQQTYQVWQNLQKGLLLPSGAIPGNPVYWSWVAALSTAAIAALLPVADPWYRLANAAAAFIVVSQVSAARRDATGSPGTRFDAHMRAVAANPALFATSTLLSTLAGAAAGTVVGYAWPYAPPELNQAPSWSWTVAFGLLGGVLGSGVLPRKLALGHWREIVAARKDWDPRWEALKILPAPTLTDVATVGAAQVFSFTVSGDVSQFIEARRVGQVSALVGAGIRLSALTCPNELNGQTVPGTVHPNKFQIVIWPSDQIPALLDPQTEEASRVLGVRAEFQSRWANLKMSPPPELLSTQMIGEARVDTFDAGQLGAAAYWPLAPKLAATFVDTAVMAIVPVLDNLGTRSQQQFIIVSWPDALPDLTDSEIDPEVAELAFTTAIVRACEDSRYGVPVVDSFELVSEPGNLATWEVRLSFPDGPTMLDLRTSGIGAQAAASVGSDCVIDHRDGNGVLWIGALEPESLPKETARRIKEEAEEDRFRPIWTQSLKMNMHVPRIQHKLVEERSLLPQTPNGKAAPHRPTAGGPVVTRYAFGFPQGVDPDIYFGYEENIKTAFFPTTFLATAGMTERGSGRPGDRIPRLIVMYHSKDVVPNTPDQLTPCPAADWILVGMVNKAFKAARLVQPEVVIGRSRCLTVPTGRRHIWQIVVRLYGGNNLSDVRAARTRLSVGFGSPWLRVSAGPEEGLVVLTVGAEPRTVTLARPEKDQIVVASLDWQQAFIDAGATGSGGQQPTLTATGEMPHNDQVKILDFDLPSGLDVPTIKKALPKLKASTGNEYIEVKPGKGGASTITILASANDPMPQRAAYDYDTALGSSAIPFATGVDGEPVIFDWATSPHLLIAGMTGAGKSACLQQLIEGVVLRGAELYILDPTKGAADFKFAEPWASGIATDIGQSAAMMKGLYAEVTRRKTLNSVHGVGSYRDLPDEVRPNHLVVVIDEFTSLMGTDQVSKTPYDDPDAETERLAIVAANNHRVQIGSFTGKIAREARSAGVTLFLATQKLSADMLSKIPGAADLKTNLARILLGNTTYGDRQSALRNADACPDLGSVIPIGRGLFEPATAGPEAIQVWYDSPSSLGEFLAEHVPTVEAKYDFSAYEPKRDDRGPSVSEVSLDDVFAVPEPDEVLELGEMTIDFDFDDLGDEETQPSDVELPAPSVDEPEPQPDLYETAIDSPWDRPWSFEPATVVSQSPDAAADRPADVMAATDRPTHKRAPIVGTSDF